MIRPQETAISQIKNGKTSLFFMLQPKITMNLLGKHWYRLKMTIPPSP